MKCLNQLKYPNKICFSAITFFRRFFFKHNPLEFNPFHICVICIFLAAKVEEKSDINLEAYFNANFKNDAEFFNLSLDLLKYYEIQLCKALNFEFLVHSPIICINHVQNILQEL